MLVALSLLACHHPDSDTANTFTSPGVAVGVEDVDGLVLAKVLTFTLDDPAAIVVTCARQGHEVENHVLRDDTVTDFHLFHLRGLVAASTYACTATASAASATFSFDTAELPDGIPTVTVSGDGDVDGAWTLTSHFVGRDDPNIKLLLFHPDGNVRWYHFLGHDAAGDLDQNFLGDSVIFGGGYHIAPTVIDLDGTERWTAPNDGGSCNHHAERLADGTVLYLSTERDHSNGQSWMGYQIIQIDPGNDRVVWKWTTQTGLDNGDLPLPAPNDGDPYHLNWVWAGHDADGDYFLVSIRNLSELVRIDPVTGRFTWKMGPQQADFQLLNADGDPAPATDWFYGQHAPEIYDDHMLIYDNGSGRPGGSSTRAAEYAVDWSARTLRKTWDYSEPGWYEPIWGDVDQLPSGHILITHAHCMDCTNEPDQRSDILEVDPTDNRVVWRLAFPDPGDGTYRSERIAGCDLFEDAEYCPSLLP